MDATTAVVIVAVVMFLGLFVYFVKRNFSSMEISADGIGKVEAKAPETSTVANLTQAELGEKSEIQVEGSRTRLDAPGLKTASDVKIVIKGD